MAVCSIFSRFPVTFCVRIVLNCSFQKWSLSFSAFYTEWHWRQIGLFSTCPHEKFSQLSNGDFGFSIALTVPEQFASDRNWSYSWNFGRCFLETLEFRNENRNGFLANYPIFTRKKASRREFSSQKTQQSTFLKFCKLAAGQLKTHMEDGSAVKIFFGREKIQEKSWKMGK